MHAELGELLRALPESPDAELALATEETLARPIHYPVGSGQGDEIAFRAGLRPMFRELLTPSELERAVQRYARAGWVTEVAPREYVKTRDGWEDARARGAAGERIALFVSRDRGLAAAGIACDLAKTEEGDRELGRLLGYPRCCTEAFVAHPEPRHNRDVLRATLGRTEGRAAARLDVADLAVFHFVPWYPCSYSCRWSIAYADRLAEAVARIDRGFVSAIDRALARHRLLLADDVQVSIDGNRQGNVLDVASVSPTARDRHPDARLDPECVGIVARATAAIRRTRRLELDDRRLVFDGYTVRLPVAPLLLPFGDR